MPSVIGGGLGDLAEVHSAGAWLLDAGFPVRIFRRAGHTWPGRRSGPFDWPLEVPRPVAAAARAVTVSSQFGVTAAPARDEPLGRAGEWAPEVEDLEAAYGPDRVLHLSLEEFARTLTSRQQVDEREREGGVPARRSRAPRDGRSRASLAREAHDLYRKFRAFDRPNLLTLFPTFVPVPAFRREFPEAIQIGPVRPHGLRPPVRRPHRGRRLLWYASPSSSERLLTGILSGLRESGPGARLLVRAPRALPLPSDPGVTVELLGESPAASWGRTLGSVDLAIVTGSRTLLEAIATRTPFLYFNGVAGRGARTRRHRPEKLASLLRLGAGGGIPPEWRRDLLSFSRARRVREIVDDRLRHPRPAPHVAWSRGFSRDRSEGERVLVDLAARFSDARSPTAPRFAAAWRALPGTPRVRRSKD